jgi:four helix bundle protein
MFLRLGHTKLEVYKYSTAIVMECYQLTTLLPADEKFNLIGQIRRAALSVKLNIAEGSSRKSVTERKRFYEIARGSLVELDAAFDVCISLNFLDKNKLEKLGSLINSCYAMTCKMTS